MKILLYGINFAPEMTGVGKYTSEMAVWLTQHGHSVRVVTAPPYYPSWKVFPGYTAGAYRREDWQGIRVLRCPLWVPATPSGLLRVLHLLSFALSSAPAMLGQLWWRPEVVWVVEPPFFCAPWAALVGRLCGACTVLHVQDFEIDAAFELGLLKGSLLRRLANGVETWLMKRFDVVSTISGRMLERLRDKGVPPERLLSFGNWADSASVTPANKGRYFRDLLHIPDVAVVALYSGNMGRKQGLELLAEVAHALAAQPDVFFVFCGNGVGKAELQVGCDGLMNVRFLDLQPIALLPDLLCFADIHLLPQRADAADLVMPSKLCGMLASGRPVVATAAEGSELASIVAQCGLVVPPGNSGAAADAVMQLARDKRLAAELGRAGRAYCEAHLDQDAILERFVERVARPREFVGSGAA